MDVIEKKSHTLNSEGDVEIRLNDIVQFLKDSRRQMLIGAAVGFIIGILYIYPKPNMYKVQVTIMPELQGRGAGGLGGLGAVSAFTGMGIDNTSSSDAIRPDLYPNVLQSVPFALDMLKQKVYSSKLKAKMTLQEFIGQMSKPDFLDHLRGLLTINDDESDTKESKVDSDGIGRALQVTKEQDGLIKSVQGSVTSTYDKKSGILTVTAIEPDPVVAATVASLSLDYLTKYITAYRTEKARKRVVFLVQQVSETKKRYQAAEYALSNYRDRNRSLFLNTAKLDEQRLQADYLLEQSVYNDLARQLEQAKIKVEEETPTFKTLEPPTVPLIKSGPRRTLTTLSFAIAGFIIALGISFTRRVLLRRQYA